jgi:hypothetical protein
MTLDTVGNALFGNMPYGTSSFLRNRIINGNMVIDQRNAGASVTQTTGQLYTVDRWMVAGSVTTKFTAQQNAGSVTPPTGFSNYLGCTSSSAYSVLTGDYFYLRQCIEGFNFADMAWGTANAKSVTLSFYVYSSLTGSFGAAVFNSATNRSYPFSYTVSSANTWTFITVTIPGDTTGTWVGATNGIGLQVNFSLGCGATYSGTANTWAGSLYLQPTSSVSVVGTNGATFYITGVQLEQGSVATPFERPLISKQLADCQRYYWTTTSADGTLGTGSVQLTTAFDCQIFFPVPMRAAPTTIVSSVTGFQVAIGNSGTTTTNVTSNGSNSTRIYPGRFVASGFTLGQAGYISTGPGGTIGFNAEL